MHAAVRQLCSRSRQWDSSWDTPVDQEDLAGTLCTFSGRISAHFSQQLLESLSWVARRRPGPVPDPAEAR